MKFGIRIENLHNGSIYSEHASDFFETGSAIKSPIAALALQKALAAGEDPDIYTMTVNTSHRSNGSGKLSYPSWELDDMLVEDNRQVDQSCRLTLANLIHLNIVDSDCTATNALIDFLDGKEAINAALRSMLGIEDMTLLTDKLYFQGVDHDECPYQVGMTTMRALTQYYRVFAKGEAMFRTIFGPALSRFWAMHGLSEHTWLFQEDHYPNVQYSDWHHKSGSIIDRNGKTFYANLVDAGILDVNGKMHAIAAAILSPPAEATHDDQLCELEDVLAAKSIRALIRAKVPIVQKKSSRARRASLADYRVRREFLGRTY